MIYVNVNVKIDVRLFGIVTIVPPRSCPFHFFQLCLSLQPFLLHLANFFILGHAGYFTKLLCVIAQKRKKKRRKSSLERKKTLTTEKKDREDPEVSTFCYEFSKGCVA